MFLICKACGHEVEFVQDQSLNIKFTCKHCEFNWSFDSKRLKTVKNEPEVIYVTGRGI